MPFVSFFGLIGNILSIRILNSRHSSLDLNNSFTNLLICLAVYDTVFLIFANSMYAVSAALHPEESSLQIQAAPYVIPLTNIALTGSVYSVVAVTVERFTTLKQDNRRIWKGRILIIFIVVFSILYNVVKFFELTVQRNETQNINETSYMTMDTEEKIQAEWIIKPTWLRIHPLYSLLYIVFGNFLVMSLLPMSSLIVLNTLVYKMIKRSNRIHNSISRRHRRDDTMAAMLFTLVVIFILCHAPRLILNIFEAFQMLHFGTIVIWPDWADVLTRCNHLMLVINSSVNIIIYTAKDFKFRVALGNLLFCRQEEQTRIYRRKVVGVDEHASDVVSLADSLSGATNEVEVIRKNVQSTNAENV